MVLWYLRHILLIILATSKVYISLKSSLNEQYFGTKIISLRQHINELLESFNDPLMKSTLVLYTLLCQYYINHYPWIHWCWECPCNYCKAELHFILCFSHENHNTIGLQSLDTLVKLDIYGDIFTKPDQSFLLNFPILCACSRVCSSSEVHNSEPPLYCS